jgi:hypothetical protein
MNNMPNIYIFHNHLKQVGKTYKTAKEVKSKLENLMYICPTTHYLLAMDALFELGIIICVFKFFKDEQT